MNEVDDRALAARLARLQNPHDDSDWRDVRRRAGLPRRRRKAVALAAVLIVASAVPAFGLADKLVGMFEDRGERLPLAQLLPRDRDTLVFSLCRRITLVSRPGRAPHKRCQDGRPKVEEIANNGKRYYWKVSYPNGRSCLASGSVQPFRDRVRGNSTLASFGCTNAAGALDRRLFPSPERPITVEQAISMRIGEPRGRLVHVSGLAGAGVASVGLVDRGGAVTKTAVRGRAYSFGAIPDRPWTAILAFDDEGKVVYRERLQLGRAPARRGVDPPRRRPEPLPPLPALPKRPVLQQGEAPGVEADIYRPGFLAIRFDTDGAAYRFLERTAGRTNEYRRSRRAEVTVQCSDVAYGAGRWLSLGSGRSTALRPEIRVALAYPAFGGGPLAPFDLCSVRGHYGRRYGDAKGMRDAVEIALTPLGRRYFHEQAAARELAYFVRSPAMTAIRDAMKRGGKAPTSAAIAHRYRERVTTLSRRTASPRPGAIGIWSNRRNLMVAAKKSDTGRRLYITLDRGRIGSHNLHSLAFLF